jgi:hypothetical protein
VISLTRAMKVLECNCKDFLVRSNVLENEEMYITVRQKKTEIQRIVY